MTNEKRTEFQSKQEQLLISIRGESKAFSDAYNEKRFDESDKLNKSIVEHVDEYNSISQMLCFDECASSEDPMRAACLKLSYPVISVKDTTIGDEIKALRRVVIGDPDSEDGMKYKQIDLLKLHKFVKDRSGQGIGHDPKWNYMVERLNLLFSLDAAVEIGKAQDFINEMGDNFAIKDAAKEIDFGVKNPKAGTPISNTGLLKATKAVVTAMVGEEFGNKVLSHDVRFLKLVSAKKSRKELTIQCANHRFMRAYLMEICNRVMTDGVYDVDYKRKKK